MLLNALVHRRYQSGVHVQIRIYPDRLVCWNDGPLPEEISMDELLGVHASHPRNPLVADASFKAGYIDTWGRGISEITEACQQAGLPDPSFEEAENGLRVTLFSASTPQVTPVTTPEATPEVLKVLKAIADSPLSRRELQVAVKLKDDEHFRKSYLEPLLKAGWIEGTIPDKPQSPKQCYCLTEEGKKHISEKKINDLE